MGVVAGLHSCHYWMLQKFRRGISRKREGPRPQVQAFQFCRHLKPSNA